jgi:glucosylceramidase
MAHTKAFTRFFSKTPYKIRVNPCHPWTNKKSNRMRVNPSILLLFLSFFALNCTKKTDKNVINDAQLKGTVACWLTKSDQSVLLQKQENALVFEATNKGFPSILVDSAQVFQTIDGFGFTLTGGSAAVINRLNAEKKAQLLAELFAENQTAISYLRISIGASDLNDTTFTYDDLPQGKTDVNLTNFSLNPDEKDLIPLLKTILAINPTLKIMAAPWSPPMWMKDTNSFKGGRLQAKYYGVYAQYFVKYIQAMHAQGIDIEAITPQNEPLNPDNTPSLLMPPLSQLDFLKNHLIPAFQKANIPSKIIIYDHNCDRPDYPLLILDDPSVKPHIWGSAFHLYAGDISVLSNIHAAHPDKHLYFTEQYTASTGDFGGDLNWHLKNVIIGSMRHWSRTAFEWNLANNAQFGPHTEGGCTTCKGALTIDNQIITRNVAYYIIAHASKFIPPNSVRIGSNSIGDLQNVAFKTPSGNTVLIVENSGKKEEIFTIECHKKWATTSLSAGSVATYVW